MRKSQKIKKNTIISKIWKIPKNSKNPIKFQKIHNKNPKKWKCSKKVNNKKIRKSEKSDQIWKKYFWSSKNLKLWWEKKCLQKKKEKKGIFLVLPFEEINIRTELSSPPNFWIQGGGVPWVWHRSRSRSRSRTVHPLSNIGLLFNILVILN